MKEQDQNMAIAEACGHTYHKPTEEEVKRDSYYQYEPNYTQDLNAMHEAEKVLDKNQQKKFIKELWACEDRTEYGCDI